MPVSVRAAFLSAFLCFGSIVSSGPANSAPTQIPIERFATFPTFANPVLSPDGFHVAAKQTQNGQTAITILDTEDVARPIVRVALGKEFELSGMAWAGNRHLLITYLGQIRYAGVELPLARLAIVDIANGEWRPLDTKSRGLFGGDVLYTEKSGKWALVASQDGIDVFPSVKRIDLATGAVEIVEKPREGIWDWYADAAGTVRAGVDYEDRRWKIWYRDKAGEKLRLLKGKISKEDESAVDRVLFGPNGSWIITNARTGRFALYEYDLKSETVGKAVFEHPTVDIDQVFFDDKTGAPQAVLYEVDRPHVHWLEGKMAGLQAKLERALPGAYSYPVGWSDDESRVLVASKGAADPGRYYLLDRKSSRMHPMFEAYPEIDVASLSTVEPIHFKARDGLEIPGYLTLPMGAQARALPLIVMPHGGPFARDSWDFDPLVQLLANRGYAVIQPEFRGSTGYGRDFVAKGHGEWGRKMQDDLDDAVAWLAGRGLIDRKRVCIIGSSYGGYAALWGAIRNPEIYRCAVSMAGVSDLAAQVRYSRKMFSASRYYKEWRSKVVGDEQRDLAAVSPINFASKMRTPILIVHGEKDERVLPDQSRRMVKALSNTNADVTSKFYPEAGHGWDRSEDLADWLRLVEKFLARHNPA